MAVIGGWSMCRGARRGGILLLLAWMAVGAAAQEGSPPSNLTLIRGGLLRAADSLVTALGEETPGELRLVVEPSAIAWLAEEPFGVRLREAGWVPVATQDAPWSVQVVVGDIEVIYSNPRQGGLFASGLLDRTIRVGVRARATRGELNEPAVDARYSSSFRDTIASTDVEAVETSYLPFTQGRVPQGGFFSTVLEPLVVIGTIAVAVLLLFTVRSS